MMEQLTQALPFLAMLGLNAIGGVLKNKTKLPNKLIPLVNFGIAAGASMLVPDITIEAALGAVGGATVLHQTAGQAQSLWRRRGQ
jgi:hypothetical protein